MLENDYYKINSYEANEEQALFHLALLADCKVYQGHFPGHAVSPGVCNIEMVKECAEKVTGHKLSILTVGKCRLTAVLSPAICPFPDVNVSWKQLDERLYAVTATIDDAQRNYMKLKMQLVRADEV